MAFTEAKIVASRDLLEAAQAVVDGRISVIEGARTVVGAGHRLGLTLKDEDFKAMVAIGSETDGFPTGDVRKLWSAKALEALQPEIDKAEAWARPSAIPACQNLLRRFGTVR